jgi:hypothetical protein
MITEPERRLFLNLAPIRFDDADVEVEVHAYQDHEQLARIRSELRESHLVRRDRDRILCVPLRDGGPDRDATMATVRLSEHPGLVVELVRNTLIDYFRRYDRLVLSRDPIVFLAGAANDELLAGVTPTGLSKPTWLSCPVTYSLDPRRIRFSKTYQIAVAVDLGSRRTAASCTELINAGMDVRGLYVGRLVQQEDRRLAPFFELAGRVVDIEGRRLRLDDHRPGVEDLAVDDAFLDLGHTAFQRCLTTAFGRRASTVSESLRIRCGGLNGGTERADRIRRFVDWLGKQSFELIPAVGFQIGGLLSEAGRTFPRVAEAQRPTFVFDPAGTKTSTYNARGLDDFGPYTSQTFTPTTPRVAVICQKSLKGEVEQFLYKFLNGIPASNRATSVFVRGFTDTYRLDGCRLDFFLAADASAPAYHRAAQDAVAAASDGGFRWNLALVQSYEETHLMVGEANPYLVTKAVFLSHQVPSQEFEIETTRGYEAQIRYSLGNMALASYAKLDGIPWLLKANPTIAHEIVVGVGSAQIADTRFGERKRFVGITTVFSGDGNYFLSNLSRAVSFDDYPDAILTSLRQTIEQVRTSLNWQPRDHVRLIFHAFKPLKDAEANAVSALVLELGDYDLEVAFLHVVQDHPFVLYDDSSAGVPAGGGALKGIRVPARGLMLKLSPFEVLVTLTGARELKQSTDGVPCPILLRLHRASTFEDLTYLARQVVTFASHTWRSILPAPLPVTVLYSDLVAGLLGRLQRLPRWNPDAMLGRVGKSRWFL